MIMLAIIPFAGFYESVHDDMLNNALGQVFWDREGQGCVHSNLLNRAHSLIKWGDVMKAYTKDYAERFADEFKLALTFESMQSPREYNFTTDRIFVELSADEAKRILAATDREALDTVAADMFTSRSGFISSYSPDVDDWGGIEAWDHNQLGALLKAYAAQETDDTDGFESWAERSLMEKADENGYLQNWLFVDNPKMQRLDKIHGYLQDRAGR